MEQELQEKFNKAKKEAETNPQKSKKCGTCKKKKEVTSLPPLIEEDVFVPTVEQIKEAYYELTNMMGVREDKKPFINKVYKAIFGFEIQWKCSGCGNRDAVRFTNYMMKNNIKIL